jgi:TetR/AcrR family transcriptional repressor for divergent bdcA
VAESLAAVLEELPAATPPIPAAPAASCWKAPAATIRSARGGRAFNLAAEGVIRDYIAARHPEDAERVTDFVSTTMSGLSAKARNGHGLDQLLATARLAGLALRRSFPPECGARRQTDHRFWLAGASSILPAAAG